MGYLDGKKITSNDVSQNGVIHQNDRLTGTTSENKQVFDSLPQLIINRYNGTLDLVSTKDAEQDTNLAEINAYKSTWQNAINAATANANTATTNANTATSNANTATSNANAATVNANAAIANADTATAAANTATSNAETATANTNAAISSANAATTNANTATTNANTATSNADAATSNADTATTNANNALKYVWVKYSGSSDGTDLHTPSATSDKYIGFCITANSTEPTAKADYIWSQFRGEDGKGAGDMLKLVYDTDNDGIVDKATGDKYGNEITATYEKKINSQSVSIPVSSWSGNSVTISVAGVTATNNVIVGPSWSTADNPTNYSGIGIQTITQAAGTLTITGKKTPTATISVEVAVFE